MKDIEEQLEKDYVPLIKELKSKVEVIEVALGLVNNATEKMSHVEEVIKDVKSKIAILETRLITLLNTLSNHLRFTEDRIGSLEKRVTSIEMKEQLIKRVYNSENLKN